MRTINPPNPDRYLSARTAAAIANGHWTSPPKRRPQLIAEAVIASYIHDISVRHSPGSEEGKFGVRT